MRSLKSILILPFILSCFSSGVQAQQWDYSSIEIVDAGRYRAFVIQDPKNKRRVKGYFHLTPVISPSMLERETERVAPLTWFNLELALRRLVEAINEYTDIKADFGKRVALSSPELLEVPWVFISSVPFHPTETELVNLGRYLVNGGFLFLDAGTNIGSQKDVNLRDILRKALAKVGKPCRFRRLPKSHPIFHCYFDFDTVPVAIIPRFQRPGFAGRSRMAFPDYLIGVDVDGRTAAVLCYADIGRTWQGFKGYKVHEESSVHYLRSLQFGINTIIYALTQRGSIMDRIVKTELGE